MSEFTPEELKRLREAVGFIDRYKFSDVFGDIAGALQRVIDVIEISGDSDQVSVHSIIAPEKVPHTKGGEHFPKLLRAIQEKESLRIIYHPYYEDKPYFNDIHPYLLKEYKNRWYLIALNDFKNQLRTYSLDRIRDIQTAELPYRDSDFDAGTYFKNTVGIIAPEGDAPKVVVAVQKTQAQYLISQPWHESQNILDETEEEIFFQFKVHPTYEFLSLLLSLGKDLRVIEPDLLKKKMRNETEAMHSHY